MHACTHMKKTARVGQTQQHWVDFDDDFSHVSSKTQKRVLRKSVQTTLRCWKGHNIMVLETQAFASKRAAPDVALKKVVARLAAGEMADLLEGTPVFEGRDKQDEATDHALSDAAADSAEEPES